MPGLRDRVAITLKKMSPRVKKKEKNKINKTKLKWISLDKIQLIHGLRTHGKNDIDQIRVHCLPNKSLEEIEQFVNQYMETSDESISDVDEEEDIDKLNTLCEWRERIQCLLTNLPDYSTTLVQVFEDFLESSLSSNGMAGKSHDRGERVDWLALYDYILCLLADEDSIPQLEKKEARVLLQLLKDLDNTINHCHLQQQQQFITAPFNSTNHSVSSASLTPKNTPNEVEHDYTRSTVIIIKPTDDDDDENDDDDDDSNNYDEGVHDNNENTNNENNNNDNTNNENNNNGNNNNDDHTSNNCSSYKASNSPLYSVNPLGIPPHLVQPKMVEHGSVESL